VAGVAFEIAKDELRTYRFVPSEAVLGQAVAEGEVTLRIDRFGLTTNNITYAVLGEALSYWEFFPAEEGWGRLPVWGFGEVVDSGNDQIETGARFYGYYPASSYLTVQAHANSAGFVDVAEHRRSLPSAYNQYRLTATDPAYDPATENEQILLTPLFFTSYLLADFLLDRELFGAETVILSSASSKTAYGLAFLLSIADPRPHLVGLTSPRNAEFARSLGVYDEVLGYGEVEQLPRDGKAVYADMAGSGEVRAAVHRHFADDLAHSALVGATHWEEERSGAELPGPEPEFFFAPTWLSKRAEDWGPEGLQQRYAQAWKRFVGPLGDWMQVIEDSGEEAVQRVYLDLLEGRADPRQGHVLSLS
jgi:Protein of unknown function (DUF2855)